MSIPHQYFTTLKVAEECIFKLIESLGEEICQTIQVIITPSCGNSIFLQILERDEQFKTARFIPIDVAPTIEEDTMTLFDYLDLNLDYEPSSPKVTAVIGNPPFGTDDIIATHYLKNAMEIADYVALILPENFCDEEGRNPSLSPDFKLVLRKELPRDVFELPDGTLYRAGACFQIWQREAVETPKDEKD